MTVNPTHISAPPGEVYWRKEPCPHTGAKVLLRTIGGTAVIGQWYGKLGQNFIAWCPLPTDALWVPTTIETTTKPPLRERIRMAFKLIFNQ